MRGHDFLAVGENDDIEWFKGLAVGCFLNDDARQARRRKGA